MLSTICRNLLKFNKCFQFDHFDKSAYTNILNIFDCVGLNSSNKNLDYQIAGSKIHMMTTEHQTTGRNNSILQSNENDCRTENSDEKELEDTDNDYLVQSDNDDDDDDDNCHDNVGDDYDDDDDDDDDDNLDGDDDDVDVDSDDDEKEGKEEAEEELIINMKNNNDEDDEFMIPDIEISDLTGRDILTDYWKQDIEIDVNDPTLAKVQRLTSLLMIKCRKLICLIKKSSIIMMYIKEQRKLLKIKRDLMKDVCTRWNSSFLMIYAFVISRPIIERLFEHKHDLKIERSQIEKLNRLEITSTEWNFLNQMKHILENFYRATLIMSGTKYASIGSAYFLLSKLKNYLINDKNDNLIIKRLKKLLLTKMIHYFEEDRHQLNMLKVSTKEEALSLLL